MKINVNFDIDAVLGRMEAINRQYPEGTAEDEALRICAAALLFVRDELGKVSEFREFWRKINTPAIDGIKISRTFETRAEADAWVAGGAAKDGDLVRVEGQGFMVIDHGKQEGLKLVRIPLPEELPPWKSK